MLPPALAHDELSLNQDVERNAVTLWVAISADGAVTSEKHERTVIVNKDKTTYAAMGAASSESPLGKCRALLEELSGDADPEDLVAWAMIRYNAYFGRLLASQKAWPGGVLRAQLEAGTAASYREPERETRRRDQFGRRWTAGVALRSKRR